MTRQTGDRMNRWMGRPAYVATAVATLLALTTIVQSIHAQQSTAVGQQLFEKRCTGCHALDHNKVGPRLGGVYGRQAGTAPGFNYSPGLRAAGFAWDGQRLNQWLTDTESVVADNNMDFHVAKAEERTEIIRYLMEISSTQKSAAASQAQPAESAR